MGRFDGVGLLYFSPERKLIEFKGFRLIDKRGDVYLRCLLTHGARSVLLTAQRTARAAPRQVTRLQRWAVNLAARRGHNTAAIAVANKLTRIIWAVWARDTDFDAAVGSIAA
jgi:transposase